MKNSLPILFHLIAAALFLGGLALTAIPNPGASAHPPMDATPVSDDLKKPKTLKDPCEKQPNNLLKNGSMGPDAHDTPFGSVADNWNPFPVPISGSAPTFRVVNNEGVDGVSQQLYSTNSFDDGVLQTVYGTQAGTYYWVRWGYVVSAKSGGSYSVDNTSVDSIVSKIGADPYGGSDAKSPDVVWGADFISHKASMNPVQTILLFPARADHVTIFLRAIAKEGGNGENRVWMDALCMEARPELGTAPAVAPLPTATPPPTATARPNATRVPPTRTPVRTVTLAPIPTLEPITEVALAPALPRATSTQPLPQSIRARPTLAAQGLAMIDIESDTLVNMGYGSVGASVFFFLAGLVLARYAFR